MRNNARSSVNFERYEKLLVMWNKLKHIIFCKKKKDLSVELKRRRFKIENRSCRYAISKWMDQSFLLPITNENILVNKNGKRRRLAYLLGVSLYEWTRIMFVINSTCFRQKYNRENCVLFFLSMDERKPFNGSFIQQSENDLSVPHSSYELWKVVSPLFCSMYWILLENASGIRYWNTKPTKWKSIRSPPPPPPPPLRPLFV